MWNSKDLTLIIVFAALGTVYTVFVTHAANQMTGITGASFLFIIGYAVFISAQLLLFRGKRWRFLVSSTIFVVLIIPTSFAGAPFDVLARIPVIISAATLDFMFNSVYGFFEKRNKLLLLTLIFAVEYNLASPYIGIIFNHVFYPPEYVAALANAVMLMAPIIVIESIAGGYMGYKVYQRTKKVQIGII
jgi:hypothetical protein